MTHIDKQAFGTFVAMLRKEKGITQKELAERLFLSDKAVSKWESGASEPSTSNLLALCKLFDVSPEEFLGEVQ